MTGDVLPVAMFIVNVYILLNISVDQDHDNCQGKDEEHRPESIKPGVT